MRKIYSFCLGISLAIGFPSFVYPMAFAETPKSLGDAEKYLKAGETYQAKKITRSYLKEDPLNSDGQKMMARILNQEFAQYKAAQITQVPEELSQAGKHKQAKTWLERSKSLMELGQYDEAALAAEHVFQYEPENQEATALIDQIRGRAWKYQKKEISSEEQLLHEEITDRVAVYKNQAVQWMQEGKLGAARLAIEKALLLEPENKEALRLRQQIRNQTVSATLGKQNKKEPVS